MARPIDSAATANDDVMMRWQETRRERERRHAAERAWRAIREAADEGNAEAAQMIAEFDAARK